MNGQLQSGVLNLYHISGVMLRNLFYLLLAVLIVVDLTESGYKAIRRLVSTPQSTEVSALDSFSPPSAAVATLKKEARVLLLDYTEARDAAASQLSETSAEPTNIANVTQETDRIHFSGFARGSVAEMTRIRPIEKLRTTVQDVDLELRQELLLVYYENHYDKELVDNFLALLQELPESPEILEWERSALDCSRRCGRTQEVQEALEYTLRYHRNLKTAPQLIARKRDWESEN